MRRRGTFSPWTNQDLVLWHGTTKSHAAAIVLPGVQTDAGRDRLDFGKGFYTTTQRSQAEMWATGRFPSHAALVRFEVPRNALSMLRTLAFVSALPGQEDFWSLVAHCRRGAVGHRPSSKENGPYYDVVIGPMAEDWQRRQIVPHADQLSFHTQRAADVLNRVAGKRKIEL